MFSVSDADRPALATSPPAPQPVQSTQLSQNHDRRDFPSVLENAKNGRKVPLVSPTWEGDPIVADLAQRPQQQEVGCDSPDDEDARIVAELKRLSDVQALCAARKSAGGKGTYGPKVLVPQVVIPSAAEIQARRKMGRPTVIDDELRHKIVCLLGGGASMTQTAAYVGVARSTVAAALARDEGFAREVHESRQRAALFPLNCLLREAGRNWRAAAWLLSYLERKTEQERSRRERVLGAAQQEIEQDLVQELRERARRNRKRADDEEKLADDLPRGCRQRPPARPQLAAQSALPCQCGVDQLHATGESSLHAIHGETNG